MSSFDLLLDFISDLKIEKVPEPVIQKAKFCLLDFLANIFAGSRLEEGIQIAEFVRGLGDRQEATVLPFGYRSSCRQSAMANGTIGALLQSHDGFKQGGNHPCAAVIPSVMAVGEYHKKTGREILLSIIAGYEVANRISAAIHPSHSLIGFAPTGTAGAFGSAAAVAKLLSFDKDGLSHAMGIAGFLLPITTYETLLSKCSVTPIHGGFAGRTGIEAAMLAAVGYKGCRDILQGGHSRGFCLITSRDPHFEKLSDRLGEHYSIMDVYFKAYPACRHTHGAVELILKMIGENGIVCQEIEKIHIKTYQMAMQFVEYTTTSSELYECQMSLPYVVAVAAMDGHLGLEQFSKERRRDPNVHEFSRKIEVVEDPKLTGVYPLKTPFVVELVLRRGKKLEGKIDFPRGDPEAPLSSEELLGKARNYLQKVLDGEESEALISRILRLEDLKDFREFISWLG